MTQSWMKENWMKEGEEVLYNLIPVAQVITERFGMKKIRSYHNNDVKHQSKALKKRRSKNRNPKTHRK